MGYQCHRTPHGTPTHANSNNYKSRNQRDGRIHNFQARAIAQTEHARDGEVCSHNLQEAQRPAPFSLKCTFELDLDLIHPFRVRHVAVVVDFGALARGS